MAVPTATAKLNRISDKDNRDGGLPPHQPKRPGHRDGKSGPEFHLLKKAVHQHSAVKLRGMEERLFTAVFGGLLYNQIWEDPRVDLEALQMTESSRLLTISSAGCNLLNYLVADCELIQAVDLNPHHMQLTKLKLAAIEHLPDYESFFRFFGSADHKDNRAAYDTYIRPHLDAEARHFWEKPSWPNGPRIGYFTRNFYRQARFGAFVRVVHRIVRLARRDPGVFLKAKSMEEQNEIFDRYFAPVFDHWLMKAGGRMSFTMFWLGIPPRQYEALKTEANGEMINVIRERVRRLACDYPIEDNYFAWQAFSLSYDTEKRRALPDYLKQENYDRLKAHVPRVRAENTSLHEFLGRQPDNTFDRFVFLDSQDWMKPDELNRLWSEVARVGKPGTRVIFRTASAISPIEDALVPELRAKFTYDPEQSRALFAKDRSAIYGGFHLYILKGEGK